MYLTKPMTKYTLWTPWMVSMVNDNIFPPCWKEVKGGNLNICSIKLYLEIPILLLLVRLTYQKNNSQSSSLSNLSSCLTLTGCHIGLSLCRAQYTCACKLHFCIYFTLQYNTSCLSNRASLNNFCPQNGVNRFLIASYRCACQSALSKMAACLSWTACQHWKAVVLARGVVETSYMIIIVLSGY